MLYLNNPCVSNRLFSYFMFVISWGLWMPQCGDCAYLSELVFKIFCLLMAYDGSVVCPDPPTVAQTMSMQVIPAKLQEKTATIFQHGQENTQRERNSEASSLCTVHTK